MSVNADPSATARPSLAGLSNLAAQEFQLARHIRDPQHAPAPPGIEERRLQIYRELFYNNVEGLLAGNFPVIRRLLADADWHALVRAFFVEHRCSTPLFPELGREFIRFVEARAGCAGATDPPWLLALAHYEWVELALEIAEVEWPPHDPQGDLLAGAPLLSPLAWPLAYDWPVHRLAPDYQPDAPEPTYLLVQRGAEGKARFHELTALSFRLLQRLDESPTLSGLAQLQALAGEAGAEDVAGFIEQGRQLLEQMRERGVLLGTHHP